MQLRFRGMLGLVLIATLLESVGAASFGTDLKAAAGDKDKHLAQIERRAAQGYIQDQLELAATYLAGRGVPQDLQMAAHWYEKAAEAGNPGAQNQIGYFYREGIGVRPDQQRAVHWFQLASASGLAVAKVNLGASYLAGLGVRQDPARARASFEEAAQKGSGLGAAYLGLLQYLGVGGAVDKAAAEFWFQEGTKLRDPVATFNLAYLYFGDPEHPHDLRKAIDLLRLSSNQGYVRAMHALAFLIVNHPELADSGREAPELLAAASEAGNWRSSILLGVLARKGQQVAKDPARALYCFHLAILQGGSEAEKALAEDLRRLAIALPADEQTKVTAEADAWFAQHRYALTYVVKEGDPNRDFPKVAVADPGRFPLSVE